MILFTGEPKILKQKSLSSHWVSENKIVSDFFSLQRPRSPVYVPIAFAADVKFHGVLYRVNFKATLGNFES